MDTHCSWDGDTAEASSVWNKAVSHKECSIFPFPNNLKFQGTSGGVGLTPLPPDGWTFWAICRFQPQRGECGAKTEIQVHQTFGVVHSVQWRGPQGCTKFSCTVFSFTCAVCLPCQTEHSCSPAWAPLPGTMPDAASGCSGQKLGLISALHWLCEPCVSAWVSLMQMCSWTHAQRGASTTFFSTRLHSFHAAQSPTLLPLA